MENTKENLESINSNLIQRLMDINNTLFSLSTEDEKYNKYCKICSFMFLSSAIESIIGLIINEKYSKDKFAFNFIQSKNKFSGLFLDYESIENLIHTFDYNNLKIEDFTNIFYPVCQQQIKQQINMSGETCLFERESFKEIYQSVKKERNKIAHEFSWQNNNFSAGMIVKFLKVYYVIYCYATSIL